MFSIITEELERNKSVKLTNFGSFDVLHKAARMGRNPKTGQAFVIKARRVISFRASKYLIDRVNCAKR